MTAAELPQPHRTADVRRPTLNAVAARAGVGRGTVSRVINGSPKVSARSRAAVEQAIAELGYVPNRAARSLVARRTDSVALAVPDAATRSGEAEGRSGRAEGRPCEDSGAARWGLGGGPAATERRRGGSAGARDPATARFGPPTAQQGRPVHPGPRVCRTMRAPSRAHRRVGWAEASGPGVLRGNPLLVWERSHA